MMSKLKIIFLSIVGELIKLLYKLHICRPLYGLNVADSRKHKVIVSLTSYGRRVSAVLPYTIYSLLRQTYKPDVLYFGWIMIAGMKGIYLLLSGNYKNMD